MVDLTKQLANFAIKPIRIIVIIIIAVLVLGLSILAGYIGGKTDVNNDPVPTGATLLTGTHAQCKCLSPLNAGWRAFSIAYVALSILGIIGMLTLGVRRKV